MVTSKHIFHNFRAPEEAKDDEKNEEDYLAEAFSLKDPK